MARTRQHWCHVCKCWCYAQATMLTCGKTRANVACALDEHTQLALSAERSGLLPSNLAGPSSRPRLLRGTSYEILSTRLTMICTSAYTEKLVFHSKRLSHHLLTNLQIRKYPPPETKQISSQVSPAAPSSTESPGGGKKNAGPGPVSPVRWWYLAAGTSQPTGLRPANRGPVWLRWSNILWMDEILYHFKTTGNHCLLVFARNQHSRVS